MYFDRLLYVLNQAFINLMNFMTPLFNWLTFEVDLIVAQFSIFEIIFGAGFTAWLLYKSLPAT